MTQLLCIGEAMAELRRTPGGFAVGFAGDTFNTAVYAARCLPTGAVGFMSRIGDDPLSAGFLDLARTEGIDCRHVARDTTRHIGIYSVATDAAGERSFAYWRDQSAARLMFRDAADLGCLADGDIIYFSAITLAILPDSAREAFLVALAALRKTGHRIAFDSNYRPRLWDSAATARDWIRRAWQTTDVALPSVDDEMALFGDHDAASVVGRILDWGCTTGALKQGRQGPIPIGTDLSDSTYLPATRVVDTTAAGDSFNGAFLAARLSGASLQASLSAGHDMARQVVGHPGAIVARDLLTGNALSQH